MNLAGLMYNVIDMGPSDQPPTPDIEDETPPPSAEEDTKEEEFVGENELMDREEEPCEEPLKEGNPKEKPLEEHDPKEDSMKDKDPGEELEEEPLEENDHEEEQPMEEELRRTHLRKNSSLRLPLEARKMW